jgi:hypothetical protein
LLGWACAKGGFAQAVATLSPISTALSRDAALLAVLRDAALLAILRDAALLARLLRQIRFEDDPVRTRSPALVMRDENARS